MVRHYFGSLMLGRGLLGYVVAASAVCSALFVLIAVWDGFRHKTYGMPPLALVSFLAAWIIAVVGPFTDQSHLFPGSGSEYWQFGVPVALGLVIFWQFLRYAPTTHPLVPDLTDRYHLLVWAEFAAVYMGLWTFAVFYQDYYVNEMEPLQNLIASASLLASVFLRQNLRGQSVLGAWLFLAGNTLLHGAMVAGNLSDPYPEAQHGYAFIFWIMAMIFILNVAYALLLPRRKRSLAARPAGAS